MVRLFMQGTKNRTAQQLSEELDKDLITYVINLETKIGTLKDRVKILEELSKTDKFEILVNLLKRVRNILRENKAQGNPVQEDLFEKAEETKLFDYIKRLEKTVNEERFYEIVNILLENAHIINDFFDNVMVIAEKNEIKNNRLELLQKLQKLVDRTIFI